MDNRIANCQKCGKVSGPAYFFKGKCPYCGYIQGTRGSSPIAGASHANSAYDELAAANARIAELEKALEPFAREGRHWGNALAEKPVAMHVGHGDGIHGVELLMFTGNDLRRAAALLEKK